MEATRTSVPDDIPTLHAFRLLTAVYGDFPAFLLRIAREHGPIVRFRGLRSPRRDIYVITEPSAVEEVLVTKGSSFEKARGPRRLRQIVGTGLLTSDEPEHLANRRLIAPAFHRRRVAEFAKVMTQKSVARVAAWNDGDVIDVEAQTNALALEIVASTLFGIDLTNDMGEISRSLDTAMTMFQYWQTPLTELFDDWPLPHILRFKAARARLRAVVDRIIAERRGDDGERGDLLSMLLSARDEHGRGGLDDEQIRDEALTILLAGHETTANALAWAFYLLQRHPQIEAALHRHVDDVLEGRDATFDDVPKLDYARAVFAEAMRLYPPAWATSREAQGDVTIGGVPLARGDVAIVSQYVTQRDPRFWRDPERFEPARFLEGAPQEKYAYFPFGGGSRICVGESFAWTEGIIAIATIAQRVRLERVGTNDVPTLGRVTLRPRAPIAARVSLRRPPIDLTLLTCYT